MKYLTYIIAITACLAITSVSLISCGSGGDGKNSTAGSSAGSSLVTEYAMTLVELKLAQAEKPYLDVNFVDKELWLKLKGAVVWGCPITLSTTDSSAIQAFARKFLSDDNRYVRPVVEKHLFSSKDKTPDSVLRIVGEVVKVDPERLQREIPSRFQLVWEDGLILEVHTDIQGIPKTSFRNTMINLSQKIQKPFGEVTLVISMTPEEAMTLYRATGPGFPTMLHPPK